MKHGLLMSLVLGITATLGALGIGPSPAGPAPVAAAASTESSAPVQLASASPVATSPAAPSVVVDVDPGVLDGFTVEPAKLAANTAPAGKPAAPAETVSTKLAKGVGIAESTCADIYLNFSANPRRGTSPLTSTFFCATTLSDGQGGGTSNEANVVAVQWYFNFPASPGSVPETQLIDPSQPFSSQGFDHTFDAARAFNIGMRVVVQDPIDPNNQFTCPPATELPFIKEAFIIVGEDNQTTASLDATDLICAQDGGAVIPLQDWVPLLAIKMDFNPDQPAPRALATLDFRLEDQFGAQIDTSEIMQFGLFLDNTGDQILDLNTDGYIAYVPSARAGGNQFDATVVPGSPQLEWEADGTPYDLIGARGDSSYAMNFVFNPNQVPAFLESDRTNPTNPQWPIIKASLDPVTRGPKLHWPIAWNTDIGHAYILAMRTTGTLQVAQTVRIRVTDATMVPFSGDPFANYRLSPLPLSSGLEPLSNPPMNMKAIPVSQDGGRADSYTPSFPDEILQEDCQLTSSFDVWDYTGGLIYDNREYASDPPKLVDHLRTDWNWPNKLYTPVVEHTRPRWDLGDNTFQFVTGEWMDLRRIFSLEEWAAVIGINAHASSVLGEIHLRDINIIMTDIGADPFGPPGNGGFDPNKGLDHMTTDTHGVLGPTLNDITAAGLDYTFNGIGVFMDNTGSSCFASPNSANGVFDPPHALDITGASPGVGFLDLPLVPLPLGADGFQNEGYFRWEYVPFPPGGGDPWWRMRLRFATGFSGMPGDTGSSDVGDSGARGFIACDGAVEPTPDGISESFSDADFFVVVRADSGFQDLSGLPGDGTGMPFGTDSRCFIEPRSWNPLDGGHFDGGMLFTGTSIDANVKYWQDSESALLGGAAFVCDYDSCQLVTLNTSDSEAEGHAFTERFQNADSVKPIRFGLDVHDDVMTYSSNNRFARESYINVGQRLFFPVNDPNDSGDFFEVPSFTVNGGTTAFSAWMDPPVIRSSDTLVGLITGVGVLADTFKDENNPGVIPDGSDGIYPTDDELTAIQYSYETVPFALPDDIGFTNENVPVSTYYPNPAPQPNLPDITNWPPLARVVARGDSGFCYLQSEGDMADEPFRNPTSSNSEATYEDDVYIFNVGSVSIDDVEPGMWLVDRFGGKYRIKSIEDNELTLEHGHYAYLDRFYEFKRNTDGTPLEVNVPDWPYMYAVIPRQPGESTADPAPKHLVGDEFAVHRGAWAIVRDTLVRNEYPRQSNWPEGLNSDPQFAFGEPGRAARLLKQHVMQESQPTSVLSFNLAGVADPIVNASQEVTLRAITVAFWGPEFEPTQLAKLDEDGQLVSSGVLLYEDTNGFGGQPGSGTFDGPIFSDLSSTPGFTDQIVPLQGGSLAWSANPEPVDLDGDYVADDLSGDGLAIFTNADAAALTPAQYAQWDKLFDNAWVLRIQPAGWVLPHTDFNGTLLGLAEETKSITPAGLPVSPVNFTKPEYWLQNPKIIDYTPLFSQKAGIQKNLSSRGNFGDDLFVVIRTSESVKSFENFRVVVPSRLPTRTILADQIGGVQLSPRNYLGSSSFEKQSPDEGPVQDFYGHDMLEVSVPTRVTDATTTLTPNPLNPTFSRLIQPGGQATPVLGIDVSQNRPENLIGEGSGGAVQNDIFTTSSFTTQPSDTYYDGDGWKAAAVGLWLVTMSNAADANDSRVEAYEITAVSGNDLTLRAGTPAPDRPWQVVKDPTFLEEVTVELYDRGNDGGFDITQDLLPLNFEDPANGQYSGVSLWRDNDADPDNTNGEFDPPVLDATGNVIKYIDLPVRLDDQPTLVGVAGEPTYQVRMVFSSPGTDDSTGRNTLAYEQQPLLRQPIPQEFGRATSDAAFGSDFFVVIRTSRNMGGGDDFNAAIVSWGPDTPTLPDPDNFSVSLGTGETPGQHEDEFELFDEFPHAERGLGFITFFREPQPVRYWSFDKEARKIVPRTEVDHSQDNSRIKYWQRSRANVATRTPILVSLTPPQVDFTADRHRQVPGGDVKFTLIATGSIKQVKWSFGDGSFSNETNPTHTYQDAGVYDVQVTVRDEFGIEDTERKDKFIEITDKPLADFIASPTDAYLAYELSKSPPEGRDVAFVDLSQGDDDFLPVQWFWNFGDGKTLTTTTRATAADPLIHRYTQQGFYTVTQQVTFKNNATSETVTRICQIRDYITIRACIGCPGAGEGEGEGEGEGSTDPPAADFTVTSEVRDKEGVVPLSDWLPLVNFTLGYAEDTPAPRYLQFLDLLIRSDSRKSSDLGYANVSGPDSTDLLEFGLFLEQKSSDDADNHELDINHDFLLYKWNNQGAPVGTITDEGFGSVQYALDFIGSGTAADPEFPVPAGPTTDDNIDGYSYIIAVRSSATWRSQTSMRCDVLNARMIQPSNGGFPTKDDGTPVDSYSPNFYDGETLADEVGYSSSFGAWSLVGANGGISGQHAEPVSGVGDYDAWTNPRVLYTPLAEHTRPHWSSTQHLLDAIGGEFMQPRALVGTEQWIPVIGINAHSTKAVHMDQDISTPRFISSADAAQLTEVNLVLTDVGGDPFGPPGNGGFNPIDMLDRVSTDIIVTDPDRSSGRDVTFNGAWVWNDTNNDGVFSPPTPEGGLDAPTGGVVMNGDRPMYPDTDYGLQWEYVPLPPGGGDPWWKLKMHFFSGTRNFAGDTEGYLEKVPDFIDPLGEDLVGTSEYTNDFFVVVRPDSGQQDVSSQSGDGSGIAPGADFRAFIEPRRYNSLYGQEDGGIYLDSMMPPNGLAASDGTISNPWQGDANWGAFEPWWPQRTVNANATQKVQVGVEVHDLALTYESDSLFTVQPQLFSGSGSISDHSCLGYSVPSEGLTDFDQWVDPFGLLSSQFLNYHTVGVTRYGLHFVLNIPLVISDTISDTLTFSLLDQYAQFSFETTPFNNGYDGLVTQRSPAYPLPPNQPALADFATWSFDLAPGEYPRLSDWADADNKARILRQKTDIDGDATGVLGINVVGSADPYVNRGTPLSVQAITVAFWGPNFDPSQLKPLDPDGQNAASGVMLWEDADKDTFSADAGGFAVGLSTGTFLPPTTLQDYLQFQDAFGFLDQFDKPVPLRNLAWGNAPELIDLDGDGVADDMNGDGLVDQADRAWVLTITPRVAWEAPHNDLYDTGFAFAILGCGSISDFKGTIDSDQRLGTIKGDGSKALITADRNPGDDLFIAVRTSDKMSRFEQFRAVVPATLPQRAPGQRDGGIRFSGGVVMSGQAAVKTNPDEDPEQDFYGNDTLEVNVPTKILDQTSQSQTITIGGAATPTLALDLATNLDLTVDSGAAGSPADKSFTVAGKAWTPNAYANAHWLIDSRYEAYQITGNTGNQLTLLSGTPRAGKWRIVKDPSFLEQLIVEFYNEGEDAEFSPSVDLLPLDIDQALSGVAIYRDNDNNPNNRNGVFDPGIDIPIDLDVAPFYSGSSGSNLQVKFVFSSPGTDDYAGAVRDGSGNVVAGSGVSMAEQARHRQWIQDTFGATAADPDAGADFFVVVRASSAMTPSDNFRVGIVNWGPNTPTEPDPDTFAGLSSSERNDYAKFEEFPWGQRAIGYVSFFATPPGRYFMDGAKAGYKDDNSGFNWVRSHSTKKRRSGAIKAITRPINSTSLVIDSASQTKLPPQILPGDDFQVTIFGRGFGTSPDVHLSGYSVEVASASDTAITLRLTTPADTVPQEPLVLIVSNFAKSETQSRSDLFTLEQVSTDGVRVTGVNPARATAKQFPVHVLGQRFPTDPAKVQVYFGDTLMKVDSVSADGTDIMVEQPAGGLPGDGARNVTVKALKANLAVASQDTLVNGFYYDNPIARPKAFFLCAPGGPGSSSVAGDWAMVALTMAALLRFSLRRRSAK